MILKVIFCKNKKEYMKRRSFLKSLGLASVAPMVVPSSVLGKAGSVAPSNRVVMASIGLGTMGTANTRTFISDKRVEMIALCDVCDSYDKYGYEHNGTLGAGAFNESQKKNIPIFKDFREVLARDDIDAITTACPDNWHAIIDIAAANAGKDVHGEKPVTRTIAEGRALCNAIKRNGVIWQTGSWQRSLNTFLYVAELIRNGVLGKVHKVNITLPKNEDIAPLAPEAIPEGFDWEMWQGPAARTSFHPFKAFTTWRFMSAYSAGKIADWGAHHIDIAHWALGYDHKGPIKVTPKNVVWPKLGGFYDQPIEFHIEMEYENGEIFDVRGDSSRPGVEFIGENGTIYVDRSRMHSTPSSLLDQKVPTDGTRLYGVIGANANSMGTHNFAFINSIINRRPTATDIETAHRSNSACLVGEIAYRTGRTIKWDYKNEQVIGDDAANRMCSRSFYGDWQLS